MTTTTHPARPATARRPHHPWTFESVLASSEKVGWTIEEVLPEEARLDFSRPFLPESLARVRGLEGLSAAEQRTLNHIRGHAYLCIFGLVEEFILPFVLDHARPHLSGDDARVRSLLAFAGEEAKHIDLFKRFRARFERDFGTRCDVIGPPEEVAKAVLAHTPLAVALTILHIEWMTQRHFTESVRDDQLLDPLFKSLLRHHWMEEAQHAKLDTLMVDALLEGATPEDVERAVAGYLEIGTFLDQGLAQQVELDLDALERATGRSLPPEVRQQVAATQHQANRWTYLGSGMTHPEFLATLEHLSPEARTRIEALGRELS